jgi:hypothetical protein
MYGSLRRGDLFGIISLEGVQLNFPWLVGGDDQPAQCKNGLLEEYSSKAEIVSGKQLLEGFAIRMLVGNGV